MRAVAEAVAAARGAGQVREYSVSRRQRNVHHHGVHPVTVQFLRGTPSHTARDDRATILQQRKQTRVPGVCGVIMTVATTCMLAARVQVLPHFGPHRTTFIGIEYDKCRATSKMAGNGLSIVCRYSYSFHFCSPIQLAGADRARGYTPALMIYLGWSDPLRPREDRKSTPAQAGHVLG